jgi:hypothetical protein
MLNKKISKCLIISLILLGPIFLVSCDLTSNNQNSLIQDTWLIPFGEIIDGGPGKDGIPSIQNPSFQLMSDTDYVQDDRLVLGVKINDELRLYPHQVMDWHEIINDTIDDVHFSLTYCPFTGTGIVFNRDINGQVNEFGVSGFLFRNNLIMYDRISNSRWSQMQLRSVNGSLSGFEGEIFQVVETTWDTWKNMYPEAKVLTTNTGYTKNYQGYAYGKSYLISDSFPFPRRRFDERLYSKTIVHSVMEDEFQDELTGMRVYPIENLTEDIQIIQETFKGKNLVFAGSSVKKFGVSFFNRTQDGTVLEFSSVQDELPVIMVDNEENRWNIFGEAVSGPRTGERLTPTKSFNGYWFAIADFYPNSCIYPKTDC